MFSIFFITFIRIIEKFKIRVLLRHYWNKISKQLKRTARNWFKRFSVDHIDLQGNIRTGCSSTVDAEAIHEAMETNLSINTRRSHLIFPKDLEKRIEAAGKYLIN